MIVVCTKILEWLNTHEDFELSDSNYAMRIDLKTKVFDINAAEELFEGLPSVAHSSGSIAYAAPPFSTKQTERVEDLFEKIKELNFCSSPLTFNEMMTLYMSADRLDKIADVAKELKRQKVSPDLFTYYLWISSRAGTLDIDGVRRTFDETAHDSNSDKGWETCMKLTNIYITASQLVNSDNSLLEAYTN